MGGELSYGLAVNLYFLYQNSVDCESELRWKSSLAYPIRLLVGSVLVLAGATRFEQLLPSLGFVMYVQSLRCLNNPFAPVNFFGGFPMKAFHLPFVCLAFHYFVEGADVTVDLIGIGAAGCVHVACLVLSSIGGLCRSGGHRGFKVGDKVSVQNLQSQAHMNGMSGTVQGILDNGRYEVFLPDLDRAVALKLSNLAKPHAD